MSGISTGIGLISGIDTATLISQLMALEARPIRNLQQRGDAIDARRAALIELSAKLLSMQNSALQFDKLSFFRRFSATSTNDSVLSASAGETAMPGTYTFRVHSLVSNHALITRGFADADKTPIGAGTLSIEVGHGQVNAATALDTLNGGAGVRRGVITITDRNGDSADIDLTTAITIQDVLNAINSNIGIEVRAGVTGVSYGAADGDRIVLEDLSGGPGSLTVANKTGGFTATDLGIAGSAGETGRIDGGDLVRLAESTPLSFLNDGNGVGRLPQGAGVDDLIFDVTGPNARSFNVSLTGILAMDLGTDLRALNHGNGVRLGVIRITDRSGASVEVDVSGARTVGELRETVNNAADDAGVSISFAVVNSYFQVTDTSDVEEDSDSSLTIEDVTGFTAGDLGIADSVESDAIIGPEVYSITTIGDVINAINYAPDNDAVVASIAEDGNGIVLSVAGVFDTVRVTSGEGSTAARDLGIEDAEVTFETPLHARRLVAGLNSVLLHSLNGGSGVGVGETSLTDRLGRTVTIDFTPAQTLNDVIDLINAESGISLVASVNQAGNGIALRDESDGTGDIVIADRSGSLAADLGISGSFTAAEDDVISGGNLQLQYVSRQTLLSELNAGRGIGLGTFRITDSTGAIRTVTLAPNLETVGQVIDAINRVAPEAIEARINDTGDGIVIVDSAGGPDALTIEDRDGGRSAADLRLAGSAETGENFIDGSFEIRIALGAGDTLDDVIRKVKESGADVAVSILNDGSNVNPYSLTITSRVSGRAGQLVVDTGDIGLDLRTFTAAQDAVVSLGGELATNPLLISSSNNTLDGVIEGVTVNLLSLGDEDVTLTVAQNVDSIVDSVRSFVDRYNDVQGTIDDATSFNPDTFKRGVLFGDPTVNLTRNRLHRLITRQFEGVDNSVSRLFSIGLSLGANNRLEFDEEKFREAYAESPRLVEDLFTAEETGLGDVLEEALDELTRSTDGVLARRGDLLGDQVDLLDSRIERMNEQLEAKRARLEAEFVTLEITLARLQDQQSALAALIPLTN